MNGTYNIGDMVFYGHNSTISGAISLGMIVDIKMSADGRFAYHVEWYNKTFVPGGLFQYRAYNISIWRDSYLKLVKSIDEESSLP